MWSDEHPTLREEGDDLQLMNQPFEVQQLKTSVEYFANILWGDNQINLPYWEDGVPKKRVVTGEDGFIAAINSSCHVLGKGNTGVRRMFSHDSRDLAAPYRATIQTLDVGKGWSFLASEDHLLIIRQEPKVLLYHFESYLDSMGYLHYQLMDKATDEVTENDVLETLDRFRATEAYKQFNEEGKRKVNSLIKYLSDVQDKLREIIRER